LSDSADSGPSVSGVIPSSASPQTPPAVTAGLEIERQWRAHPGLRLPDAIGGWQAVDGRDELLVDHYYDTEDLRLAEQRARLRVRRAAASDIATLKRRMASDGNLRRRIEIEGPYDGDPETSVAFIAARLLTQHPLALLGRIVTARTTRVYAFGARSVEIARDRVSYPVGADEWRLEAEGEARDVHDIGQLLERLSLGLAPVRRGKVQTLLRRGAA
jgi:inorganic triphosphatase YgiF